MALHDAQDYSNREGVLQDILITFKDITQAEKKNYNFAMEAKAVHDAAVSEWNRLFEAIQKLAKEHKDSPSFKDSQMYKKWFEPATTQGVNSDDAKELGLRKMFEG